jgi:hypothetical protein
MLLRGSLTHLRLWAALAACAVFLLFGLSTHGVALSAEQPTQEPETTLSLSPESGTSGTKVTARGKGYCQSVTLSFDGESLATDEANEDGEISLTFTVPEASAGPHPVTSSSPCGGTSTSFEVVEVLGEPPSPTGPSPQRPRPGPEAPPPPLPDLSLPPPPGSTLAELQDIINRELQSGVILYNPPERMRVGETDRVEVRISRELSDGIRQGLRGRGVPRVETLLVGTFMKAELRGEAFDVIPIGSDIQPVLTTGFAEWRWDVTPKVSGTHPLYLVVTIVHEGTTLPQPPPFERRIEVAVNPMHWLKSNWEKLLGALIGVVGLVEAYRRLRPKRDGNDRQRDGTRADEDERRPLRRRLQHRR